MKKKKKKRGKILQQLVEVAIRMEKKRERGCWGKKTAQVLQINIDRMPINFHSRVGGRKLDAVHFYIQYRNIVFLCGWKNTYWKTKKKASERERKKEKYIYWNGMKKWCCLFNSYNWYLNLFRRTATFFFCFFVDCSILYDTVTIFFLFDSFFTIPFWLHIIVSLCHNKTLIVAMNFIHSFHYFNKIQIYAIYLFFPSFFFAHKREKIASQKCIFMKL